MSTGNDVFVGLMHNRSKISLEQLTVADGASNTAMFGEQSVGNDGSRILANTWMGCGALPTAWGLPDTNPLGWWHFSSRHTAVVQFGFGDGSVQRFRAASLRATPGLLTSI